MTGGKSRRAVADAMGADRVAEDLRRQIAIEHRKFAGRARPRRIEPGQGSADHGHKAGLDRLAHDL
jgi:hypothetical protein